MALNLKAVIAIDVGTSSARAGIVDEQLNIRSIAARPYRLSTPRPGFAEQDPEEIFHAVSASIQDCLHGARDVDIIGVCLDTAMHSFLPLDNQGNPLTNAWTWADMRAVRTASRLAENAEAAADLYQRTGCPVHAMYFPAKALWLREEDPRTFARADVFTSIKGYLLMRLTGIHVEDLAIASGYGLLNIKELKWDDEALAVAGLKKDRLPHLVEPRHVVGPVTTDLATRWGLARQLPVVAGGSDGPLANVGAGCVRDRDMAITVGTSSAVRMFTSKPTVDTAGRTWSYYLGDDTWVVGGAINGGASSLTWMREAFPGLTDAKGRDGHAQIDRMAAATPAGSDGLLFAPYLAGERNPGLQGEARGYMVGLSLHHSAKHFVRATMEGIAYQIAWVYHSVADVAGEPQNVRLTGGFIGSSVWPGIVADVLGRPLAVPAEKEGSLIGCAAFGLSALESRLDWRDMVAQIPVRTVIEPNMANHALYARHLDVYKEVYGGIRPHFSRVLSLQE